VVLDVTDVTCPLTWVRTKLALERMAPGEELGGRGWSFAPASAREADEMHDSASTSPPSGGGTTPEWERQAHAEADAEIRRRSP